ncbi:MAG: acyl-ACP--UDP-N-acetylglucosamine O-acyltransferase [Cyanobacteria bacterium P01_G01_bin.38]
MTIHPTAVIEPGAQLGDNVTVGAFAYIDTQVKIGSGCTIGPRATILRHTQLGNHCRVHAGAVIGDLPQDLAFQATETYVQIGNNCVLREGVTVHRGTKPDSVTVVGNDCLLMVNSHVAHNAKLGDGVILANGALIAGYAEVGERAFVSGGCLVHQFTRVGRLVMMSGGSAIQKDVPPFCMTRSVSANTIMGLNTVGLRRAGVSAQERKTLKQAFQTLFQSDLSLPSAVEKLQGQFESPLVQELAAFIQASERGICKFLRRP